MPSLTPPPIREKDQNAPVWQRWYNDLQNIVGTVGGITWDSISFTGSNLTDIETRNHEDLQNLNTTSYTHLSASDASELTGGGSTTLHSHPAGAASTITVTDAASDTTCWLLLAGSATGDLPVLSDSGLTYNASTNVLGVSGGVAVASTAKVYLDGVSGGGDTYFVESAGDVVKLVVGGKTGLFVDNTALRNIGMGDLSVGATITTGFDNVCLGYGAGYALTSGGANVLIGRSTGSSYTQGSGNVAIGADAGKQAVGGAAKNYNVFVGYTAGGNGATCDYTVAVGYLAGQASTGTLGTYVGPNAGRLVTSGTKNTYLGAFTGSGFETSSNQVILSDGDGNVRLQHNATDWGIPAATKFYFDGTSGTRNTYIVESSSDTLDIVANNVTTLRVTGTAATIAGNVILDKTITAAATTGAQTINKTTGSVNFAAAATSLVVTNSLVTTNSIIIATVATNDATMTSVQAVAASGSFTLYANAAATAETRVNFIVTN